MTSDSATTARDLFLSRDLTEAGAQAYLASRGFADPKAADEHLQALAQDLPTRLALGEVAEVIIDALASSADPDGALVGFTRYLVTRAPISGFLGYLKDDPRAAEILAALFGASPSLGEVLIRNPEFFHWLQLSLKRPAPDLIDLREALQPVLSSDLGPEARIEAIKRFRRREYLGIAARDLLGVSDLPAATAQLSLLADVVIDGVLGLLSADLAATESLPAMPGRFAVIAMGKLGGLELNYSSDIDLIYVYEPDDPSVPAQHELFHKLSRRLTKALGDHTDESYLYRVDLRLRPMGRHGDVACTLKQYGHYYDSMGETFERFALIKARPVAGDPELGAAFMDLVRPFVYRRYLDHAAFEEIARYKRRAEQAGDGERDVKTGRGGIREIELFTQILQVTYGAEHDAVRSPTTLRALTALREQDIVDADVHQQLDAAYRFLRMVEHRLQIVHQSQTHTLNADGEMLDLSARRMGFESAAMLEETLAQHRNQVHAIYADLLAREPEEEDAGRLLFRWLSGEISDDDTTGYLHGLGFRDPDAMLNQIRALDEVPSLVQSRSTTRNLLSNLVGSVLPALLTRAEPERILNRFERIVSGSGASGTLFRTLLESAPLRDKLATLLDSGDLFADRLSRHPELLDAMVQAPPDLATQREGWERELESVAGEPPETRADRVRRLRYMEEFKILVEWLDGGELATLQEKLSGLADCCVTHGLGWLLHDEPGQHDTEWVVVAMGKLGGLELTAHSDLDLVFLYRGEPNDGALFTRAEATVKKLYRFLEEPTQAGVAYELDTRLRPDGKKGPLALPLDKFETYLAERAERWERLAWTRYRVVTGSETLTQDVSRVVTDFVYQGWDDSLPEYARHIRGRMENELGKEQTKNRFHLKVGHGGLSDIDFLMQLLQIRHGKKAEEWRVAGTRRLLADLPPTPLLDADDAARLRDAHAFLRTLETRLRIEADAGASTMSTDPARLAVLGARMGMPPPTGETLKRRYQEVTTQVREIFDHGMERLAAE